MQREYQQTKIGKLLRKQRKKLKLPVKKCLQVLGLNSRQMLNYIENGEIRLLKDDTFKRVAEFCQINPETLQDIKPQRKLCEKERKNSVGDFLTKQRLRMHLSQDEVAKRAGIGRFLSDIERGKVRPRRTTLQKIALVLKCEIPEKLIPTAKQWKQLKKTILDSTV